MNKNVVFVFLALAMLTSLSAETAPIHLVLQNGRAYAPVSIQDTTGKAFEVYFMVDSGTSHTLMNSAALPVSEWEWERNASGNFRMISSISTVWGPLTTEKKALMSSISIGPRVFKNLAFLAFDNTWQLFSCTSLNVNGIIFPVLGILGTDTLFSKSLALSLSAQTMWLDFPQKPRHS